MWLAHVPRAPTLPWRGRVARQSKRSAAMAGGVG